MAVLAVAVEDREAAFLAPVEVEESCAQKNLAHSILVEGVSVHIVIPLAWCWPVGVVVVLVPGMCN